MSTYTEVTNFQKQSGYFWPTLYYDSHTPRKMMKIYHQLPPVNHKTNNTLQKIAVITAQYTWVMQYKYDLTALY